MSDFTHSTGDRAAVVHSSVSDDAHTILLNKVSWGAIFAGVVVALIVQVLLTMLGAGIGVATLDPGTGDNPEASTFSMMAGIWYMLSGIVAAYVGGYIAARMSGKTQATTGALHGLTTWAVTTLLVLYFLTSTIGAIVGGAFSGIASVVGGIGETAAQTAAPLIAQANPFETIEAQIRATGTDPEALNAAAVNSVRALVVGNEADAVASRQRAAQALAYGTWYSSRPSYPASDPTRAAVPPDGGSGSAASHCRGRCNCVSGFGRCTERICCARSWRDCGLVRRSLWSSASRFCRPHYS